MFRAVVAAAMLLAGCYNGPPSTADHRPEDPDALLMPLGWVGDTVTARGGAIGGIYPVRDRRKYCCWMGADAVIDVRAGARARNVLTTIFIPELPLFDARTQSLAIAVDGGRPTHFAHLGPGLHFLRVPLRVPRRAGLVHVALHAGMTFSPLHRHLNGDSRELAVYVKAVRAE
jgi:hypothetical protein